VKIFPIASLVRAAALLPSTVMITSSWGKRVDKIINERALRNLVRIANDYNHIKLKSKAAGATRARVHKVKSDVCNESFFSLSGQRPPSKG
jgi:hypothetical protein